MNPPLVGSSDKVWCTFSFDGVIGLVSAELDPDRAFLVLPTVPGRANPKRFEEIMGMIEQLKREGVVEQLHAAPTALQELVQRDICYKGKAGELFRTLSRNGVEIKVFRFGRVGENYAELAVIVSELGPWIVKGASFSDYDKFIVVGPEWDDLVSSKERGKATVASVFAWRAAGFLRSRTFLRCAKRLGLPFFTVCMSLFGLLMVLGIDTVAGIVGVVLSFAALSLIAYRTENV